MYVSEYDIYIKVSLFQGINPIYMSSEPVCTDWETGSRWVLRARFMSTRCEAPPTPYLILLFFLRKVWTFWFSTRIYRRCCARSGCQCVCLCWWMMVWGALIDNLHVTTEELGFSFTFFSSCRNLQWIFSCTFDSQVVVAEINAAAADL